MTEPKKEKKRCVGCGDDKELDDFYRLRKGEEARQARCKLCDNNTRSRGSRKAVFRVPGAGPRVGSGGGQRIDVVRGPNGELVMVRK